MYGRDTMYMFEKKLQQMLYTMTGYFSIRSLASQGKKSQQHQKSNTKIQKYAPHQACQAE